MTTLQKFHERNKKNLELYSITYPNCEFIFIRGEWAYIYKKGNPVQVHRADIDGIIKMYIAAGRKCGVSESPHDKEIYDRWRKRCADIARDGVEYYLVNYTNYSKRLKK